MNYAVGSSPEDVAVGDVNGDGFPDLVTADLKSNSAEVLLNSGPVSLSPSSLAFTTQVLRTTSAPKNVILTNTGGSALNIVSIMASAEFSETNTCGSSVAAGASCTISVKFSPAAAGKQSGMLTIIDSAGTQAVPLTGTGTAVKLAPTSLNFGTVKVGVSSTPKKVTVTNVGGSKLSITGISLGGLDPQDFSETNTCGNSLAANENCSISVTFTPTATSSRSAYITLTDSDPTSPQRITLGGTGD
ncbi:MAG: choice-of-anchor D domain-containing protein [Candidatus Sulfotelmatobacter sp.]